jgi:hypothetical protein
MYGVEWAVACAVELLTPRGSCSKDRWITFDFRVEDPHGNSFEWLAQYSPTSNYIDWRTVLKDGVPHTELSHRMSWYKPRAPWVPAADLKPDDVQETKYGEPIVAPGYVISNGSHDSCWRDNATRLHGFPMVETGKYTDQEGKERSRYEPTYYWKHFREYDTIKVLGMKIEGPVAARGWGDQAFYDQIASYKDGAWLNDTELTGPWAIIYGMSKLVSVVNQDELIIRIDGSFSKGEYGERGFKERRKMVHYRIKDGKVTHKGITEKNEYFRTGWESVLEPYVLDERQFRLDCGFKEKDLAAWRLTHLFPEAR